MVRGPSLLTPSDDSGRTIQLTGDFLWWQGATPPSAQGEYRVHKESVARGAKVERWTVGDDPWEMVNWNLWCWRKDERDALRIYLQIVIPPGGARTAAYENAFPSSIEFRDPGSSPDSVIVRVRLAGGGQAGAVEFEQGAYVWNRSYCRVGPCIEEQIAPDGSGPAVGVLLPRCPFDEEGELEKLLGMLLLAEEAERLSTAFLM